MGQAGMDKPEWCLSSKEPIIITCITWTIAKNYRKEKTNEIKDQ